MYKTRQLLALASLVSLPLVGCGGEQIQQGKTDPSIQIQWTGDADLDVTSARVKVSVRRGLRGVNRKGAVYSDGTQVALQLANGTVCHIDQQGSLGVTGCEGQLCLEQADLDMFEALGNELDAAGDPEAAQKIGALAELTTGCRPPAQSTCADGSETCDGNDAGIDGETDLGEASASRCWQARNNANGTNGGNNWVHTKYQNGISIGWFSIKAKYAESDVRIGPKTGACMGRCGKGCDWKWAGTKYTQACSDHDKCVGDRSYYDLWCDKAFIPTIWDTAAAENCF